MPTQGQPGYRSIIGGSMADEKIPRRKQRNADDSKPAFTTETVRSQISGGFMTARQILVAGITLSSLYLMACSPSVSGSSTASAITAPTLDVYPDILRGSKSMELGELILLLMPDAGAKYVGWDLAANSPIRWTGSSAYTDNPGPSGGASRSGWVRVNVQGSRATMLRDKKYELGWTVAYSSVRAGRESFLPAKFGVGSASISPGGGNSDDICFGTAFDGCDFAEPLESLVKAGIQVVSICSGGVQGGHKSAYLLTQSTHAPTVMVWERGGGSGGVSASVTLQYDAKPIRPEYDKGESSSYDASLCKE
jgi:hypothetical protein